MLRKLRGSESPAPVPSYLYSPLVPPYFCAYIVFEISTKVNFCFINFDASSLPAFSPILRLFIWEILADSAIMVKSVRVCRPEPAIFKKDIIMSKIVNEAKIGHLRSGLLPLLPDVHCLHRRRFSAWPSRYVQKMQLDDQPVTGTAARRVPSSHKQYCTVSAACFWRSCKKQQHARTAAQVQTVRACFTLSERANASSLRSGDSCRR